MGIQFNLTYDIIFNTLHSSIVIQPFLFNFEYEKEPWNSRGLRVLPVDNYVVLYIPDSDKKVVTILRVMYTGRDIDNQLNLYTKQ